MAGPYATTQDLRDAIPTASWITSNSPTGALLTMNIYIRPDALEQYTTLVRPVMRRLRAMPENQFCEMCVHPHDKGHVRIVQAWSTDSDWFRKNVESTPWFGEYIQALVPMRDPNRLRVIEHFDRVLID